MPLPAIHAPLSATERDRAILVTPHAASANHASITSQRRALEQKAALLTGFEHFRRLCLTDLREAFREDRAHKTRAAKLRRLAWLRFFRYFADHRQLTQQLRIDALDRQGNYVCELTDAQPETETETDWDKLVRLAGQFGITERDLTTLYERKQRRRT